MIKIEIKLTPIQERYMEAFEWLVSDSAIAQGRSTLLAIAFLKKSLENPGRKIYIFDHYPNYIWRDRMIEAVRMLIPEEYLENFTFYKNEGFKYL